MWSKMQPATLLALLAACGTARADLYFSSYISGSNSAGVFNNKAIELYNSGPGTEDLSGYEICIALGSSSGCNGGTIAPTVMLAAGDFYSVAKDNAQAGLLALVDSTEDISFFNGDDFVGLYDGDTSTGTLIDAIGTRGSDPGNFYVVCGTERTKDRSMLRKDSVTTGNDGDWTASAGTNSSDCEWIVSAVDDFTVIEAHMAGSPTEAPTDAPTFDPTSDPTMAPTDDPTAEPTMAPTMEPTDNPTMEPTDEPTDNPTLPPTDEPTDEPTMAPTDEPTDNPTMDPTDSPTMDPTDSPTLPPTDEPTGSPTVEPTDEPTTEPTPSPSDAVPSAEPTMDPTDAPTMDPTDSPTMDPTMAPTDTPTMDPTDEPTMAPTMDPTDSPTMDPTDVPTMDPTDEPTMAPTMEPTDNPTMEPTDEPTDEPTLPPTDEPTDEPTMAPTNEPTDNPTMVPTDSPTMAPTDEPTMEPTMEPTTEPTEASSTAPTTEAKPSMAPSELPTASDEPTVPAPSATPTDDPTAAPTTSPTDEPTMAPTDDPTMGPTMEPTVDPTDSPTMEPTDEPTYEPSSEPSAAPTISFAPTEMPSEAPSAEPTVSSPPSNMPSEAPSDAPTISYPPSPAPTVTASEAPTYAPTKAPTDAPVDAPTDAPVDTPTDAPVDMPTSAPTELVSIVDITLPLNGSVVGDKLAAGAAFSELLMDIESGIENELSPDNTVLDAVATMTIEELTTITINDTILSAQVTLLFSVLQDVRCGQLMAPYCVVEQVSSRRERRALQTQTYDFSSTLMITASNADMQGTSPADETTFLMEVNDRLSSFEGVVLSDPTVTSSVDVDVFAADGETLSNENITAVQDNAGDTSALSDAIANATGEPGLLSGDPVVTFCSDPTCSGSGTCTAGTCVCDAGFTGTSCETPVDDDDDGGLTDAELGAIIGCSIFAVLVLVGCVIFFAGPSSASSPPEDADGENPNALKMASAV